MGNNVGSILIGRKYLLQNRAKLELAQNTSRFDIGQNFFDISDAAGKGLHFTETLVYLLKSLADDLKRVIKLLVQSVLQFFVYCLFDGIELRGITLLHRSNTVAERVAHIIQLLLGLHSISVEFISDHTKSDIQ